MASPSMSTAKTTTAATSKVKPAKKAVGKAAPTKAQPTRTTPAKTTPAKTTPAKTTPAKTTPAKVASKSTERPATEFILLAPEAKEVTLVGDFSNWQENECPMRRAKDGSWKKRLQLDPGRYEYRFVVDGNWWTDPENPDRQQNPYGQDNSVLVVP